MCHLNANFLFQLLLESNCDTLDSTHMGSKDKAAFIKLFLMQQTAAPTLSGIIYNFPQIL